MISGRALCQFIFFSGSTFFKGIPQGHFIINIIIVTPAPAPTTETKGPLSLVGEGPPGQGGFGHQGPVQLGSLVERSVDVGRLHPAGNIRQESDPNGSCIVVGKGPIGVAFQDGKVVEDGGQLRRFPSFGCVY